MKCTLKLIWIPFSTISSPHVFSVIVHWWSVSIALLHLYFLAWRASFTSMKILWLGREDLCFSKDLIVPRVCTFKPKVRPAAFRWAGTLWGVWRHSLGSSFSLCYTHCGLNLTVLSCSTSLCLGCPGPVFHPARPRSQSRFRIPRDANDWGTAAPVQPWPPDHHVSDPWV